MPLENNFMAFPAWLAGLPYFGKNNDKDKLNNDNDDNDKLRGTYYLANSARPI
jgi:hypothetical protein